MKNLNKISVSVVDIHSWIYYLLAPDEYVAYDFLVLGYDCEGKGRNVFPFYFWGNLHFRRCYQNVNSSGAEKFILRVTKNAN